MKTISRSGLFLLVALILLSGATTGRSNIRAIKSPRLQAFVNLEAQRMLAVTPNAGLTNSYRFYLGHGKGKGWAGLSFGNHVIYLDYSVVKAGFMGTRGLKSFRIVLAHEIGHDVAGHRANNAAIANIANAAWVFGQDVGNVARLIGQVANELYSRSAELEADRLGIEYWKRLGWDCKEWVYSLERGLEAGIGDFHHPPEVRLRQAADLCLPPNQRRRIYQKVEQFKAKALDERDEKQEDKYDE